ncbi:ATP-binding protein [Kutzneria buriramensis]|uniref:histidine kinase n=1 Tax=Kutzneria buriramensis TaxID=1045776 RepID=A0A3E0H0G2_9PSEU|nr:ATP-binding protein [Kutzneria buriramensis]REH36135.1 histidine kinase [Kutzneria buriramensis]
MDLRVLGRWQTMAAVATGAAGATFAAFAITLSVGAQAVPGWALVPVESVGVVFLGVGLFAWFRRPEFVGLARLMVAVGVTWYVGDLQFSSNPALKVFGFWLFHLNLVVLAHLLLSYPTGKLPALPVHRLFPRRPGSGETHHRKVPLARYTIAMLYATVVVTQGMRALVEKPLPPQGWGSPQAHISVWAPIGSIVGAVFTIVTLVLVVLRWRDEPSPVRKARGLYWLSVDLIGVLIVVGLVAGLLRPSVTVESVVLLLYAVAHLVLGAAVLTSLLHTRLATQQLVTELLAALHGHRSNNNVRLRDALATALEDPTLTVHYRLPDSDDYVDAHGKAAPVPAGTEDRAVTFVTGRGGQVLAALVHEPVLASPILHRRLEAVVAAAGVAIENAQLQKEAENRAHLRGLATAEQATRKTIRNTLHDGPQTQLAAAQLLVGRARALAGTGDLHRELGKIFDTLQEAVTGLREVVDDLYPSNLGRSGLREAVSSLARHSPTPLVIDIPADRWDHDTEEAAFFIISEAVCNALKHANATRITVRVQHLTNRLHIEVSDNGTGAANDSATGSGLHGMRNRATARNGTWTIEHPDGGGTTIRTVLPCV